MVEVRSSLILRTIPVLLVVCLLNVSAHARYSGSTAQNPYLRDGQTVHVDDVSTLGPVRSPGGDGSSLALKTLGSEAPSTEGSGVEGRIGDGLIRLTWTSASGSVVGYRIYRRDYGPSPHYGLRATVGAGTRTFEDIGLDNSLPYFYKVVPVLADGKEANAIGELTLCPMRAPIWKYVSPEPAIAAVDMGVAGVPLIGRPGSFDGGLGLSVSDKNRTVIRQAATARFYSDSLENPVAGVWVDRGAAGEWDGEGVSDPECWESDVVYSGFDGKTWRIGKITPGTATRGMILDIGPNAWDSVHVRDATLANGGGINELFYAGFGGSLWQIGHATWSGSAWVKDAGNPVLSPGRPGEWDSAGVSGAYVVQERLYPPLFTMYYTGSDGVKSQIGYATSNDGAHWAKHIANPVLPVGPVGSWCCAGVGHPTGYDFNGETHLWFEGTDGTNTAIGRAIIHRSRVFGRHTAIFGPEWFERTAEYFNVPTIYDALYDLLIELHGFPSQGADYQTMSYYSRVVWASWNGNPYTQGLSWYSIFDYPSYPRVGSYFPLVLAHESGHNFMYYLGGTLGAIIFGNNNNSVDYHWLAGPMTDYSLAKLAENYSKWGLTKEQIAQVISQVNRPRDADIFAILASEYGWGIWQSFFRACRPGIIPTSLYESADTSAKKNTMMICILSVACQTDLRQRFRQEPKFINEIDDGFYHTIYPVIASAMTGEKEPPSPPSNLTALVKPGPCVKLCWAASSSSDINHYNVYSDNRSSTMDYSLPFGVAPMPLDTTWTSPTLPGGGWYRFALRGVDHWGNEEKNTSTVVSVFVPQSPAPFIRDWLLLGPISNTDTATLTTTDYTIMGETHLDPFDRQVEGTYRWRRAWTTNDLEEYLPSVDADRMDLGRLLSNPFLCASYAFTRVFVPSRTVCDLRVSHDDDCRIWLNSSEVYAAGYTPSEVPIAVVLQAGWNRLCLKVCNYWYGYSFTTRFCDAQGGAVPGMVWSVDAPGSSPVAGITRTELAFNDVHIGQNTSLGVNVLNRGTGTLAVSNVEIRGESASEFRCSPQRLDLAAGTGSRVFVSFSPTTVGAKSAELMASTNDPNLPTFTVALSGLGCNNALYVNDDSSSGDVFTTALGNDQNSGLTPASPLRHLSTVIERFALQDGDVIYLDTGLYVESANVFSTDHEFTVRGAGKDLTVIDGGGVTPCLVFNAVTDANVEQLTLQNGKGLPFEDGTRGGALFAQGSRILVRDAVLQNSTAEWGGGAFLDGGDAKLLNVTVSGNTADSDGGGVYFGSAGTMQDCVVTSNQAECGGGIFFPVYGNGGVVENSIVSLNVANSNGGGLFFLYGGLAKNCEIYGNRANAGGGAAYFYGDGGVLENSMVSRNVADRGGGLLFCFSGLAKNCEIHGNRADAAGGAAYFYGNGGVLENSMVSRNVANSGGGLLFSYGGLTQNCTVVGNLARSNGGGAYCASGGTVGNTIMYSNRASNGSDYFNDGQGWSYSYCRASPRIPSGPGNIDADPYFANPGYWDTNGSVDALDDDFWVDGDYHLKSQAGRWDPKTKTWVKDAVTSPCIDTGEPSDPVGDEPPPNGGRINMGMYGGTAEASKSYP